MASKRASLVLSELRHHCREVWGLDVKDKTGDSTKVDPHTPDQQRVQLNRVVTGLQKLSKTALGRIRKGYIVAVAEVNGVVPEPGCFTKAAYISTLLAWVSVGLNFSPLVSDSSL